MTKLIKTAAALALGASIVTTALVPADASAAAKYKVKSGKLVVVKTGKLAKGTIIFNKIVYKNGVKLNGLKGSVYYNAGKKATGTYKGAYYVKGIKKVTTGTYNKAYYVKGIKKVTTGLYANKYYKVGKLATGTYKDAYYVNGIKKVTTGTYNKAYYVKGVKKVTTGLFEEKFYFEGALNVGYKLYDAKLYKDADLNVGFATFETKVYKDAILADGTFDYEGSEEAFEAGVKVGAKVASVETISGTQLKVTFNRTVDAAAATAVDSAGNSTVVKLTGATLKNPVLSPDGRTLTVTSQLAINADKAVIEVESVSTKANLAIKTERYISFLTYKDIVAPTVESTEKVSYTTLKVNFSEPVQSQGTWTYIDKDGNTQNASIAEFTGTSVEIGVDASKVVVGSTITFTGVNIADKANNLISPNVVKVNFIVGAKDEVPPIVNTINQISGKKFEITFSKPVTAGNVTINGIAASVAAKTTGAKRDTTYIVTSTTVLNEAQTVAVSNFANVDGTSMVAYSKVVAFKKDEVAPTVINSKVVAVDKGNFVQLTFNKEVTAGEVEVTGTYIKDYVTTSISKVAVTVVAKYPVDDTSKKVLLVPLTNIAKIEGAKYDLTLTSSKVVSESDVPMAATSVSFVLDSTPNINDKVFTKGDIVAKSTGASTITVEFNNEIPDGATATLASNYNINGQTVKSVKLVNETTAELTLNPGQISTSGSYNLTLSGIKVKGSTRVMGAVTLVVEGVKENIAPTILAARLNDNGSVARPATAVASNPGVKFEGDYTGKTDETVIYTYNGTAWVANKVLGGLNVTGPTTATKDETFTVKVTAAVPVMGAKITVTASEKLATPNNEEVAGLEVYAGTTKLATSSIKVVDNTIVIILAAQLTNAQLNAGLTVKPTANNNITDDVGNALTIAITGAHVTQ